MKPLKPKDFKGSAHNNQTGQSILKDLDKKHINSP